MMKAPKRLKGIFSARTVSAFLAFSLVFCLVCPGANVFADSKSEQTADSELENLKQQYEALERKINESEKNLNAVENGKKLQKKNISALETQIVSIDSQIDVLENKMSVLSGDISRLNSSINAINEELSALSAQIDETNDLIYETEVSIGLITAKVRSRMIMTYMAGNGGNLEFILGAKDLHEFFTRLQMVMNVSEYDAKLVNELNESRDKLAEMKMQLETDKTEIEEKKAVLTGEKTSLSEKQDDYHASEYVLEMKKQLSRNKHEEAVKYFKTLDKSSDDYAAMLKLFSDEQDKVDREINAYLVKYGSSASQTTVPETTTAPAETTTAEEQEEVTGEEESETEKKVTTTTQRFTTVAYVPQTIGSQFTTKATTTTTAAAKHTTSPAAGATVPTTSVNVVSSSIDLIWPLPYPNCYISAYFGQYPHGGEHHGLDICVRGGTEGKRIAAAASGRVIRCGYGHWSMGNYVIIDHGAGLFTAYYHQKTLYVSEKETVAQGQIIGLAGSTGNVTGPHLHFEVRMNKDGKIVYMNPLDWVTMP